LAAYALGQYAEAAEQYEKAFALHADPALLYDAAQAHRLAGNKPRALSLYENYLRHFGDQAQNVDDVQRLIVALKAAIAEDERARSREPTTVASPSPPPATMVFAPPPPQKPLVKKAWFWAVIGVGAAVVVGTAVGLGVGLSGNQLNPVPSYGTVLVR
jgi:tetratricopeptide (TPR) repeat protein